MIKVVSCQQPILYYIFNEETDLYLHSDGTWQHYTINKDGVATGFYKSENIAIQFLNKFRPEIRLKDLKPGDKFQMVCDKGMTFVLKSAEHLEGQFKQFVYEQVDDGEYNNCLFHSDANLEVKLLS